MEGNERNWIVTVTLMTAENELYISSASLYRLTWIKGR